MDIVDQLNAYLQAKSMMAYLLVFFGGILASLTPCVYPMIPVTVAYIGGRSGNSKSQGFFLSLSYVFGLAVTYAALGAIAALSGNMFGDMGQNPTIFILVGIIFVFFGLSMIDVFTIPTPAFLSGLQTKKVGSGFVGAFFLGMVAGLVASPCLTPVLGALLVFVAKKQNLVFGTTLLFTFGLGLGVLFMLLGTFAGLISSMPKSGRWMDWVKKGFAFLLIGCAAYFFFQAGKMSYKGGEMAISQVSAPDPDTIDTGIPPPINPLNKVAIDKPAPDFTLKNHDNKNVTLSSYKGKVVLLDFWATWCKPCWKAIPGLKKMQEELHKKDFSIIGILMDRNAAALVPGIHKKAKMNYPLLVGTSPLQQAYDIRGFPTLVIIDRKGIVRKLYLGGKSERTVEKEILALLGHEEKTAEE